MYVSTRQLVLFIKDHNRKIRNTVIIYIYESLIGSKPGSSSTKTDERMLETQQRRCAHLAWYLEPKFNHSILQKMLFLSFYQYLYPSFPIRILHQQSKIYLHWLDGKTIVYFGIKNLTTLCTEGEYCIRHKSQDCKEIFVTILFCVA